MKLGPQSRFDKSNTTSSKKFEDEAMSVIYHVVTIFQIYDQFEQSENRIPDTWFGILEFFYQVLG